MTAYARAYDLARVYVYVARLRSRARSQSGSRSLTVDPRRPPDPNRLKNCVNAAVWADELLRTHNPPDLDLEILDNWFARAMATATSVTAHELDNLDEPIDVVEHPFKGTWVVDLGPVVEVLERLVDVAVVSNSTLDQIATILDGPK